MDKKLNVIKNKNLYKKAANNKTVHCGIGGRIVQLYPPACRKRRLKGCALLSNGNVRGHKTAGSEDQTRPGQKFKTRFLLHVLSAPPQGPQYRVPVPIPSLETHLKSE